jgi:hypothetical protein
MKKASLLILFLGLMISMRSQTTEYFSLLSYIHTHTKQNTQNRLIAVSVWSPSDKNSREINTQFNEACYVYQNAKLKGGNKGILGVLICNDNDEVAANIALKKDGINNVIVVNASQLNSFPDLSKKSSSYNAVYDMNGNMIYENLASNTIFDSIRNLITR